MRAAYRLSDWPEVPLSGRLILWAQLCSELAFCVSVSKLEKRFYALPLTDTTTLRDLRIVTYIGARMVFTSGQYVNGGFTTMVLDLTARIRRSLRALEDAVDLSGSSLVVTVMILLKLARYIN